MTPVISAGDELRVHRAGWLAANAETLIENACVQVQAGRILYAGPFDPSLEGELTDHGPGLLLPPLVNAHTHLELSALAGMLNTENGFEHWVRDLLQARDHLGTQGLVRGLDLGINELVASGSLIVGDISSLGLVAGPLADTVLAGILFREYLGNALPETEPWGGHFRQIESWAGHAPHTTSPLLLQDLKKRCRKYNTVFSIHVCESDEEMEFITTGRGPWADLLRERGIDYSSWGVPCESPVSHLDRLRILDENSLCVHMIRATEKDLACLAERGSSVCLCPRSNLYLHQTLPKVTAMIEKGIRLCLGTDSLASTPSLSVLDEAAFLAEREPGLAPGELFRMATENGALALGLGKRYGRLEPGMDALMIYADARVSGSRHFFESMYHE